MSAQECREPRCRNTTTHPLGLCHHHRAGHERRAFTPPPVAPPPPLPDPETWEGECHPTGGYDATDHGRLTRHYLRHGVSHRVDGPASLSLRGDGTTFIEEWAINGASHRIGGPAYVRYADDGSVENEEWAVHGRVHREDGPAVTLRASDGSREQTWIVHGLRHRLDGPARIVFDRYGAVSEVDFFIQEERVSFEVHARIREAVEGGAPLEWALAYATGQTR